ncbi:MAG TPA: putative 2OG-Fe(II) oxygenase [Gammaproteobacteria bacterium]
METHFPVNVLVRRHAGVQELHAGITAAVRALEMQYGGTDQNAATNDLSTTQGGFQTPPAMDFLELDNAAVRDLKQRIVLPAIEQYLQDVWDANPYLTPFLVKSWANILRRGHWQAPHMHPTEFTVISGVYYVDVPPLAEPSGCIEFINPHPISVSLGGQTATRRHQPQSGELLLFPPFYMHYVHPVVEDAERVVVAFDVRLRAGA